MFNFGTATYVQCLPRAHVQFSMHSIVQRWEWSFKNRANCSLGVNKDCVSKVVHPPLNIEIHGVLVGPRAHRPANLMSGLLHGELKCFPLPVSACPSTNSCAINDRASFLLVKSSTVDLVNVCGPGYRWSARWCKSSTLLNMDLPPPPNIHLVSTWHHSGVPMPSLFFATFPLLCIILNTNRRTK